MIRPAQKSTIDLFTSHAWRYGYRRDDFHRIARPWRRDYDYRDHSISKRHPLHQSGEQLEATLEWIVSGMDVLIVMAGMWLIDRRMMEIEIFAAVDNHVPIVPILSNGQERVPELARRYAACDEVRWRSLSVRRAVLGVLPIEQQRAFLARRQREWEAAVARAEAARRTFETRSPSLFDLPPLPRLSAPPPSADLFDLPPVMSDPWAPRLGAAPPEPSAFAPFSSARRLGTDPLADALANIDPYDVGIFGALSWHKR